MRKTSLLYLSLVVMIYGSISVNSSENNKQININPINDNTLVNNTKANNFKYKFYDQKNNIYNFTDEEYNHLCEVVSEQIKNKKRFKTTNHSERIISDDINSWCHIVYEFGEELLPFLKNESNIRPILDLLRNKKSDYKSDVVYEIINNINNIYQLRDIILYSMCFKSLLNYKSIENSDINNNIVEKIKKIKLDDAYNDCKKLLLDYINDTFNLINDLKYFLGIITNKTISNTLSPYRDYYLDNTKLSSKCKNIFIANISTVEEYIKAKQGFINWDLYEYIDMLGEYSKKFSKYLHSNE